MTSIISDAPAMPDPGPAATGPRRHERRQIGRLAIAAVAEAVTLILLLFAAVPLKHLAGWPAAVTIVGPVHGLAFLAFVWLAIETAAAGRLSRRELARLVLMACVPFGGFASFAWLRRKPAS